MKTHCWSHFVAFSLLNLTPGILDSRHDGRGAAQAGILQQYSRSRAWHCETATHLSSGGSFHLAAPEPAVQPFLLSQLFMGASLHHLPMLQQHMQ